MRKVLLAVSAMLFMAGLVVAAEVTVVKYDKDKKEVTVKDGDAEKTYKITDKTKVYTTDKDGNKTDSTVEALEKRLSFVGKTGDDAKGKGKGKGKGGFGAGKLDITTDGDTITEVKMRAFGKKQDKNQ
jgi:hypothetical protein